MRSGGDKGPEEHQREWTCTVCQRTVRQVVGVAALIDGRLRMWLSGFCTDHEDEVRASIETQAREGHPPEIMIRQVLRPEDVPAWTERVRREAGITRG